MRCIISFAFSEGPSVLSFALMERIQRHFNHRTEVAELDLVKAHDAKGLLPCHKHNSFTEAQHVYLSPPFKTVW